MDPTEGDIDEPAPSWVVYTSFALCLIALGISTYLTIEHFTGNTSLVCTDSGGFNCGKVTTSTWSVILGIPVAVLGLVQYVAMSVLCSPWGWRAARREVHVARLAFAVVGMVFVLWLIAAEALLIHAFCLWCSGVHLITFLVFILVIQSVPRMLGWTTR